MAMILVRMTVFPRRRRALQFIALLAAVVALAFVAGCVTRPKAHVDLGQFAPAQRDRARENLAVFNAVWDLVNRKHYEARTDGVDWEQLGATYGVKPTDETPETLMLIVRSAGLLCRCPERSW